MTSERGIESSRLLSHHLVRNVGGSVDPLLMNDIEVERGTWRFRQRFAAYALGCWWWVGVAAFAASVSRGAGLLSSGLGAIVAGIAGGSALAAGLSLVRRPRGISPERVWDPAPEVLAKVRAERQIQERRSRWALALGLAAMAAVAWLGPRELTPHQRVCDLLERALSQPQPSVAASYVQEAIDSRAALEPGRLHDALEEFAAAGRASPFFVSDLQSSQC